MLTKHPALKNPLILLYVLNHPDSNKLDENNWTTSIIYKILFIYAF